MAAQPTRSSMFGGMLDNPLAALAMTLGPAMMAYGFNQPGLASMGPQMLGMAQRSRERQQELDLERAEQEQEQARLQQIAGMFGPASPVAPPASVAGAPIPGGAAGPSMVGSVTPGGNGAGAPAPASSMFGGLSEQERQIARGLVLAGDPAAALSFAGERTKPQQPTTAMREAEAMGYAPGTPGYTEYLRQRTLRPATEVSVNVGPSGIDYGDPPKDMTWARDAEGNIALQADPNTGYMSPVAVPVVGGPVAQERTEAEQAKAQQAAQRSQTADIVTQDINEIFRIMEESPLPVTGAWAMVGDIPVGSPQRDVRSLLDSVRANVGFDKLQAMRAASPTGGALGQVSERENVLLQSALGSLEQSQTETQFRRNLQRVRDIYDEIVNPQISDLTNEQLDNVDWRRLEGAQLDEYIKRMEAITGG